MKGKHPSWRCSQVLALLSLAGAVWIMAAPFRGSSGMARGQASVLPLLAASSIADAASFHAVTFERRAEVSETSVFRSAPDEKRKMERRREILVRKQAGDLEVDFRQARTEWKYLGRHTRAALDEVVALSHWTELEVHGAGAAGGSLARLRRVAAALGMAAEGGGHGILIGNGRGAEDGAVEVDVAALRADAERGRLGVRWVGDFHREPPTRAQLESFGELLDYLELKCGRLAVSFHEPPEGGGRAGCLGAYFPVDRLRRAIAGADP